MDYPSTRRKAAWLGLIALFWLILVFGFYYLSHKPITPTSAISLGRAAGQLLVALLIISLGGALGRWLLPELVLTPLARLALQAALGLGIFSFVVLLVATMLGFSTWIAWGLLLLSCALLYKDIWGWWKSAVALRMLYQVGGRYGKVVIVFSGLILAATLTLALSPAVKFDALAYHLALPHQYLAAGRLLYIPENIFWGMPQVGEMLYLWGVALAGDEAAAVLGWWVGCLALVGIWDFTRQRLGAGAAWTALASLLAGYTTAIALSWAYIDWFTILFGFATLVCLQAWLDTDQRRPLVFAGIFTGFAFGSKYSAGALMVAGVSIVAIASLRRAGWRRALSDGMIYLLVSLGVMAPWLLKNLIATGNPLYPFFFPTSAMSAYRLDLYQGFPVWGDWRDALLLSWQATIWGHEGAPGFAASVGPLLLGLGLVGAAGMLFKVDRKLRNLYLAASLAGLGLLLWALAGRLSGYLIQTRLYMAFFPALALVAGGGYRTLAKVHFSSVRLGRVVASLVALALALNALQVSLDALSRGAPQVVTGIRSEADYLDDNLGWYAPAARAIGELSPQDKVLMLWEPRSLYCQPRCYPDEVLDRWSRDLKTWGDPKSVLSAWQQAGFTHVLYYRAGAEFIRQNDPRFAPDEWRSLEDLLVSLTPSQTFGEAYTLYKLEP